MDQKGDQITKDRKLSNSVGRNYPLKPMLLKPNRARSSSNPESIHSTDSPLNYDSVLFEQELLTEIYQLDSIQTKANVLNSFGGKVLGDEIYFKKELYGAAEELMRYEGGQEVYKIGCGFLAKLLRQPESFSLTIRLILYSHIKDKSLAGQHLVPNLALLNAVTKNGRFLDGIERDIGAFIGLLLQNQFSSYQPSSPQLMISLLSFALNLVKFNFSNLTSSEIYQITFHMLELVRLDSINLELADCILEILDVIVRYGFIPDPCLDNYIELTCLLYNCPELNNRVWDVIKNVFKSHCAYRALTRLCELVETQPIINPSLGISALRILILSLWSPNKIPSLSFSDFEVLSSIFTASILGCTTTNSYLCNALRKFCELQISGLGYMEWCMIFDIAEQILLSFQKDTNFKIRILEPYEVEINQDFPELIDEQYRLLWGSFSSFIYFVYSQYATDSFTGDPWRLMNLLQKLAPNLTPTMGLYLLEFYDLNNTFLPSNACWLEQIQILIQCYMNSLDLTLRSKSITLLSRCYFDSKEFYLDEVFESIVLPLSKTIGDEETPELLVNILAICLDALDCLDHCKKSQLINILTTFVLPKAEKDLNEEGNLIYKQLYDDFPLGPERYTAIYLILSYVFSDSIASYQSLESLNLFNLSLNLIGNAPNKQCRIIILKILTRIRANSFGRLFITQPLPSKAYIVSIIDHLITGKVLSADTKPSWLTSSIDPRSSSEIVCHLGLGQIDTTSSEGVYSINFASIPNCHDLPLSIDSSTTLLNINFASYIKSYLTMIIDGLDTESDWDTFKVLISELPSQLANHMLFSQCPQEINRLRQCICTWISSNKFAESIKTLPDSYKRGDVYLAAYRILSVLIAYKPIFTKLERDEIVMAFQLGLRKWAQTAKLCIHNLTICCYDLPISMTKLLPSTLVKLSQIMSNPTITVHILEFLACLARIPDLYANFVDEDFKRIFGISLQYIQYNSSSNNALSNSPPTSVKILSPPTSSRSALPSQVNDQAHLQYVLLLAYQVISIWFVSLKLVDRKKFVPFIIRGLYLANSDRKVPDEITNTCLDMLARCSFSSLQSHHTIDPLVDQMIKSNKSSPNLRKSWIRGDIVVSIQACPPTWAHITIRRPSTSISWLTELDPSWIKNGQLIPSIPDILAFMWGSVDQDFFNLAIKASSSSKPSSFPKQTTSKSMTSDLFSSDYLAALCDNQHHQTSREILATRGVALTPIFTKESNILSQFDPGFLYLYLQTENDQDFFEEVPNSDTFTRAIGVLDRMPIVDFHKVGVLYVGPGQSTEHDILCNQGSPPGYSKLLSSLGAFIRLRGCKEIYTGGLDTEMDLDGTHTVAWITNLSQVVFHVATLMPTELERDPLCTQKKRHIGNDYVTIVYNDSTNPYKFDTLPGQFNLVNIVITPLPANANQYYMVQAQVRPDLPDLLPILEPKLVSQDNVGYLVRQLALHAAVFAQVFLKGGTYATNWIERLRQIKRIRQRLKEEMNAINSQG